MFDADSWRASLDQRLESWRGNGVLGLAENVLSLAVVQAAIYILPMVTLPYLVRVLGVDRFGLVAFAQATVQFFIIVVDFGFNLSATREIALHRADPARVARIVSSVLLIKLLLMLVGLAVLGAGVAVVDRLAQDPAIFLISYGIVLGHVLFPVWFFQGMEKMKLSALLTLLSHAVFVLLIFVVVRGSADYRFVPLLRSLGLVLAGVISLWIMFARFRVRPVRPSLSELRRHARESRQFFAATLSSTVLSSFNSLVLGLLTTNAVVGVYAAAEKLFVAMRGLYYPIINALYPFMTVRRNLRLFKKVFYLSLLGACVLGGVVFVFHNAVVAIVFGPGYESSAELVRLFALLVPAAAASLLLGYPLLAAYGYENYANAAPIVGAIVHILIVLAIVPLISARMVVWVFCVTQCLILAVQVYGVRKRRLWSAT